MLKLKSKASRTGAAPKGSHKRCQGVVMDLPLLPSVGWISGLQGAQVTSSSHSTKRREDLYLRICICKLMYFVNKWVPSFLLLWMSDCSGAKPSAKSSPSSSVCQQWEHQTGTDTATAPCAWLAAPGLAPLGPLQRQSGVFSAPKASSCS